MRLKKTFQNVYYRKITIIEKHLNVLCEVFCCCFRLYGKQKKYALASTQYDKVIDLMEKVYGHDSLDLIPVFHDFGAISFIIVQTLMYCDCD